jgi:hypothetical protein
MGYSKLPINQHNSNWLKHRLTKRAPDVWESARFQALCVA